MSEAPTRNLSLLGIFRNRRRESTETTFSLGSSLPQYSVEDSNSPTDSLGGFSFASSFGNTEEGLYPPSFQQDEPRLTSPSYSTLLPTQHASAADFDDSASARTVVALDRGVRRPPRYSTISSANPQLNTTSRHHPHSFELRGPRDKPWLTLHVNDFAVRATHGHMILKVMGGDILSGMVQLDIDGTQTITSIRLNIKGRVITGYLKEDAKSFIDHSIVVWERSMGDPRENNPGKAFDGAFPQGVYRFPFSFTLPVYVNTSTLVAMEDNQSVESRQRSPTSPTSGHISPFLSSQGTTNAATASTSTSAKGLIGSALRRASLIGSSRSTRERDAVAATSSNDTTGTQVHPDVQALPPAYFEKAVNANVRYELSACVSQGKFRLDKKLRVPIIYTPPFTPQPSSLMRQAAYREGRPLPGPDADPEGWFILPPVNLSGTTIGQRHVQLECTLSLARPLSYARGTVIPCFMTINCQDQQALDECATPNAPRVELSCVVDFAPAPVTASRVKPQHDLTFGAPLDILESPFSAERQDTRAKGKARENPQSKTLGMGKALWWIPPKQTLLSNTTRVLEGEMHLAGDLHPSTTFPVFSIEYAVDVLAFHPTVLQPDARGKQSADGEVYVRQVVTITAVPRSDEPTPVPFLERDGRTARRRQSEINAEDMASLIFNSGFVIEG